MWRLFIQVFPLAVMSLLAISTIVITLILYFLDDQLENDAIKQTRAQVTLLQSYLGQSESDDDWQQRLQVYKKEYIGSVHATPIADIASLPKDKLDRLISGETVAVIELRGFFDITKEVYFRVKNTNQVIYLSSSANHDDEINDFSLSINISVLLLFLLFISAWLSFHWSELRKLMKATDQISKGDFSTRVKLKRYASTHVLGDKINQMASYIERLVSGQRDLIHSVSHELRTPIARLEFGLELLKKASNNPVLFPRIEDLEKDVAELSELVTELLQLASVGQQYRAESKPFSMNALLESSIQVLKHDKAHKKIITSWPDDLGIYNGDQRLLERAIRNLLTNADKYSLTQISLSAKKLFGGGYVIMVDDDGPGIPEEEREHIFEPFYRLENTWDKKISGYGLGLAIVHKVITIHNGSIKVGVSKLGGASFVIKLPKK